MRGTCSFLLLACGCVHVPGRTQPDQRRAGWACASSGALLQWPNPRPTHHASCNEHQTHRIRATHQPVSCMSATVIREMRWKPPSRGFDPVSMSPWNSSNSQWLSADPPPPSSSRIAPISVGHPLCARTCPNRCACVCACVRGSKMWQRGSDYAQVNKGAARVSVAVPGRLARWHGCILLVWRRVDARTSPIQP